MDPSFTNIYGGNLNMGILQRFGSIMEANINALLDKCEDPAKMVDQYLIDLRHDLAEVKKETAAVMADETNAKRKVDACKENIQKYQTSAENALKSGNEEDAKTLIAKKQQYEEQLVSLEQTYAVAHENAEKMKQMHNKLVNDIDAAEMRKDSIKAKVATAKAQEHMNKIASGVDSSASLDAFNRMEAKANKMLDTANAEAELNASTESATADNLAEKYASGSSASVDDELAAMKAKLGM